MMVGDELARRGVTLPDMRHLICGGSQPPRPLIERFAREFGLPMVQAWGMTETSPLASVAWPKEAMRDFDEDRLTDVVRTQAGQPLPGVQVSIRGGDGAEVAWDGETMGNLLVRGPWVVGSYLGGDGAEQFTDDGWFRTGDVAIGSPDGYFVIADRTKDLIKSGGEWISSVDMEGAIMAMPEVAEAVVIAIPDPKWQERPLACVVPRQGQVVDVDLVRAALEAAGFARWQLPDRVEIIEAVPRTSVGKFDKKALRARFPE
jgi:fatty-acyl-CoA synthase